VRIKLFAATVLMIVYLVLAYIAEIIEFPFLGMDEGLCTFLITFVYILIITYPSLASYQYVYFSDEGESIVFRYFTAGIIGGKKNSVEIPKAAYKGYKIEMELLGLRQYITLYQKVGPGIAQYPPIYISALNNKEKGKVVEALEKILA